MIHLRLDPPVARLAGCFAVIIMAGCSPARPIPLEQAPAIVDADTSEVVWGTGIIVESAPELVGGLNQLWARVQYPKVAQAEGIQGRVFVEFWVREDGRVDNVQVLRGIHPLLDEEAVRVVREEATFRPARQRGKPVAMRMSLPIEFRL